MRRLSAVLLLLWYFMAGDQYGRVVMGPYNSQNECEEARAIFQQIGGLAGPCGLRFNTEEQTVSGRADSSFDAW